MTSKADIFQRLFEQFSSKRIAIVGDFILDEYVLGDTKRVSREAPVVVIDYRESLYHPGGAANAAQNIAALGGMPVACGVVGDDREGTILVRILSEARVDASNLVREPEVSTAVKTRILAGDLHAQRQQVARIDRSRRIAENDPSLRRLAARVELAADQADGVLVSDYGLGSAGAPVSAALAARCRARGIPLVVDSRFNLLGFAGATVATPNEVELFEAMTVGRNDRRDVDALAARVIERQGLDGLIVTRGSEGMLVRNADGRSERVGIVGSRDVTDVTGAGDTVAASVTLALSCGASVFEAAEVATYAASVVVMKRGTATASRREIEEMRAKHPRPRLEGREGA
jgi:rfaE bifunctional protein kinase chain/domain